MRYEPHEDEYAAVPKMSDDELLEYFLYRIFETDEVWGLKDGAQLMTHQVENCQTLPLWAYQRYAEDAMVGDWEHFKAVADSVEFFAYQTLSKLGRQQFMIQIMPHQSSIGCLISPQRLFAILENMMEARDNMVGD